MKLAIRDPLRSDHTVVVDREAQGCEGARMDGNFLRLPLPA
jgi:hypothetical protein